MKSWLSIFAIVFPLIGFAILGDPETSWADWILFDKTEDADFYYDIEDIVRSSSGTGTFWTKLVYTTKGFESMVALLENNFENLEHSIDLVELDCMGRLVLSIAIVYFSRNGNLLEIKESDKQWQFIPSDSIYDVLHRKVCR